MPSIVAVNFWLRGPGLNSGELALRSRQRGGILDISPWWQPRYYARFRTVCILSVRTHVSRGNTKSDLDDKYFPAPERGLFWQTPPCLYSKKNWGLRILFDMKSSGMRWTRTGWGIRSSFSGGAKTTRPQRIKRQRRTVYFTGVMRIPRSSFVIWNSSKWHQMKCEILCAVQRLQKGDLEVFLFFIFFFYLKMKSVQICAEQCHHGVASLCHVVTI